MVRREQIIGRPPTNPWLNADGSLKALADLRFATARTADPGERSQQVIKKEGLKLRHRISPVVRAHGKRLEVSQQFYHSHPQFIDNKRE